MGTDEGFKLAPALVAGVRAPLGPGTGGPAGRPYTGLVLMPIYNRKTSSRPMTLPPFVIRLPNPSSLVSYPSFPATD
jgi:hypothetical protein